MKPIIACLLLLVASPLAAEDRPHLKIPAALMGAAGALDIYSTMTLVNANKRAGGDGGHERNPIVGWMEPKIGTGKMLAVGAAMELGVLWVTCKLLCENHPQFMRASMFLAGSAHAFAATGNYFSHTEAQAERRRLGLIR